MKKIATTILVVTFFLALAGSIVAQQATYVGSNACKTCHNGLIGGPTKYFDLWASTLHSKIHAAPTAQTVTGDFKTTTPISMGASYGNATVTVRTDAGKYYAKIGANGPEYEVVYTYGGGWKQRYLVKIGLSYFILPIQWNSNKYLDNSSGSWTVYTQGTWFNADGSVKATNTNSFRAKSWDKNCMGCHVTGYRINTSIAGSDTSWVGTWGASSNVDDINVGCESCHGPGSLHASTGDKTKITHPDKLANNTRKLEVCGQCHNRASSWNGAGKVGTHEFAKDEINNKYFVPGDSLGLYMRFDAAPNTSGAMGTWQDGITARQHHQQYQEWQVSMHFKNPFVPMNCFTCHEPHGNTPLAYNLRNKLTVGTEEFAVQNDDNTLCLSCHAGFGPFAGITKAMVKAEAANRTAIGAIVNAHTKHKVYDPMNTANTGGGGRCSKCHLAKTATTAKAYDIHSHTFWVLSPKKTLDYKNSTSPVSGMLNSCAASCHRNPATGSAIPTFGIANDVTLTDWRETTDIALADTLWNFWKKNFPTSVQQIASAPGDFILQQNYPNPFNPSTSIQFGVSKKSLVQVIVYDLMGKEVRTLVNQEMTPGTYKVSWNSKNDYGEAVPSGTYLYRLKSGNFSATKKMLLMK